MKRRTVVGQITAGAALGALGFGRVDAQSAGRSPRIGVLRWGSPADDGNNRLIQALAAIGYVENQTIAIEWRFVASRDQAQRHAAELVALKPDLLIGSATPAAAALRDATKTVPIVIAGVADPVGAGLVATLARPGGNITGVSSNLPAMVPKQLQLLGEVIGGLQRVAFLGSSDDPATKVFVEQALLSAKTLGIRMQVVLVSQRAEFEAATDTMLRERTQAVIVQPLFGVSQAGPLVELLVRRKLPCVSGVRPFVVAGGLMSYGFSQTDAFRRTASFVDRVLKGAAPASLPVEEPTIFELTLNLKTARALGIAVPQSLLLRADEVIQ